MNIMQKARLTCMVNSLKDLYEGYNNCKSENKIKYQVKIKLQEEKIREYKKECKL